LNLTTADRKTTDGHTRTRIVGSPVNACLSILDLGHRPYGPTLQLQEERHAARSRGECPDTLILVEHPPVYTLGRSARTEHVLLDDDALQQHGIEVHRIGRGGDVTYHGPGQLVGYPILDLGALGLGAADYVARIEAILRATLADFGVESSRDPTHRGVWIGNDKIAAIGVRIARRVSMHGFALNVRVDLAPYKGIVPCGIRDRGVTSLHRLVPSVTMADAKARVVAHFTRELGYRQVTP
jgi:lipoate-protein ligase B